jgi:hypothetical protein
MHSAIRLVLKVLGGSTLRVVLALGLLVLVVGQVAGVAL